MTHFRDLLVISRMAGARNGPHSVRTIFAANLQYRGEKRENGLAGPNSRSSLEFAEIYLTERWIPKTDRSIVTWERLFRFYSNRVFVLLAPPQSLNVWMAMVCRLYSSVYYFIRFRFADQSHLQTRKVRVLARTIKTFPLEWPWTHGV